MKLSLLAFYVCMFLFLSLVFNSHVARVGVVSTWHFSQDVGIVLDGGGGGQQGEVAHRVLLLLLMRVVSRKSI